MSIDRAGNLFDGLPEGEFSEELVNILAEKKPGVRVERIVSKGHCSPDGFWYDQEESELVFVLRGTGVLEFQSGQSTLMKKGDYVLIDPHEKHRVVSTSADEHCVWLAIFF